MRPSSTMFAAPAPGGIEVPVLRASVIAQLSDDRRISRHLHGCIIGHLGYNRVTVKRALQPCAPYWGLLAQ